MERNELDDLTLELRELQQFADPENYVPAISGTDLMEQDFEPMEYVVKGLLPKGLSILSGAPKVGKSWLALDLCLHVAKGEPFWGMEVLEIPAAKYAISRWILMVRRSVKTLTFRQSRIYGSTFLRNGSLVVAIATMMRNAISRYTPVM